MKRKPAYRIPKELMDRTRAMAPGVPELCQSCLSRRGREVRAECWHASKDGKIRIGHCAEHKSKADSKVAWIGAEERFKALPKAPYKFKKVPDPELADRLFKMVERASEGGYEGRLA